MLKLFRQTSAVTGDQIHKKSVGKQGEAVVPVGGGRGGGCWSRMEGLDCDVDSSGTEDDNCSSDGVQHTSCEGTVPRHPKRPRTHEMGGGVRACL